MSRFARRLQGVTLQAQEPVATPNGSTLNSHAVMVDGSNKVVSWVANQSLAYAEVSRLAWEYLLTDVTIANGKPAYYSYSYMNPDTQEPVGWPHNPAGLYSMMIESALKYYQYSADSRVLDVAEAIATHHLANGMTLAGDNWSNVPYSSGDAGSLTYHGASYGNTTGVGDGDGVLEPDKVGELGYGFVLLYKRTASQTYLNAAINCANALASHVRTGNVNQSPWPYRVFAATGNIREQYCSHLDPIFNLFDSLIDLNAGNPTNYLAARTTAWNWMMTYPMQNNNWSAYFEDVDIQSAPDNNLNQLNAMMMARYLLENPDKDANWETHVRGLITWVEQVFGTTLWGADLINEQQAFYHVMGSHTSRYASVNALLYEKTGDTAAKEKAYRSFNWATYMARPNGVVIDGPTVNNMWFTDGYGDYVRHFMTGMGAVPEFAPNGQTHILHTTSVVTSVTYGGVDTVSYQTFGNSGIEKIKLSQGPSTVILNGTPITQRGDLNAEGWVYNSGLKVLSIRRDTGSTVTVN